MRGRWRGSGGMGSSWYAIEGIQRKSVSYPAREVGYVERVSGLWGAHMERKDL